MEFNSGFKGLINSNNYTASHSAKQHLTFVVTPVRSIIVSCNLECYNLPCDLMFKKNRNFGELLKIHEVLFALDSNAQNVCFPCITLKFILHGKYKENWEMGQGGNMTAKPSGTCSLVGRTLRWANKIQRQEEMGSSVLFWQRHRKVGVPVISFLGTFN